MIYIQIPEKFDARGFLLLAKSDTPVCCLADNIYGVHQEQLKALKTKKIPFKTLNSREVHLPKVSAVA